MLAAGQIVVILETRRRHANQAFTYVGFIEFWRVGVTFKDDSHGVGPQRE